MAIVFHDKHCSLFGERRPRKCNCGADETQIMEPMKMIKDTDWQSIAAERGIEVGIMREALEAIAGATWWDGKSHNERIAELQQIASDALRDAK